MNDTIEFRITRNWWSNFTSETVVEDAMHSTEADGDALLTATKALIEHVDSSARYTKQHVIVELDLDHLDTLYNHADWYAEYWGEMIDGGIEWVARGRSSEALAIRVCDAYAELEQRIAI